MSTSPENLANFKRPSPPVNRKDDDDGTTDTGARSRSGYDTTGVASGDSPSGSTTRSRYDTSRTRRRRSAGQLFIYSLVAISFVVRARQLLLASWFLLWNMYAFFLVRLLTK
ncbi:hypothetical protein GGR52DRAFT_558219 [Hypoxylon sp. FL1284]|nr:hypothetical protein GGR52DRAFT_558219 [Hypoxylon sp. FL1284]